MSFAGGSFRGGRGFPAGTVVWSVFRRRSAAAAAEGAEVPGAPQDTRLVRQAGAVPAGGGGSVDRGLRWGSLRDTCRCAGNRITHW